MALDLNMSQFHDIFFEESIENLEVMEANLLSLDIARPEPEVINTVFRAAHSIKGGAGTFGFSDIADFTHVVETCFDEVREQKRALTRLMVDAVLESVDCLRYMIAQSKSGQDIDKDKVAGIRQKLIALPAATQSEATQQPTPSWHIYFHPHDYFLKTGNDPYRLFRELAELGEMQISGQLDRLPPLQGMDPELCYLSWHIQFSADVARGDIEEMFEWVDEDCELHIELGGERRQHADRRAGGRTGGRRADDMQLPTSAASGGQLPGQESNSIRVNTEKVDNLVNLVGELVITVSMLSRFASTNRRPVDREKLKQSVEQLERNTRDLQEQTLNIRMLPIDFVFQRLPRLVHDLSRSLGKQVELKLSGNATEIDKTVLEKIGDPLVHLIRNALDHGIETPAEREAAGKEKVGVIALESYHEGGNIVVQIRDDGAGIDPEAIRRKAIEKDLINVSDELTESQIHNLIFLPGFSTANEISGVSGRGVGADVVRSNIVELGGNVKVASQKGIGTTFSLYLPLTLAIMDGQLIRVGEDIFVISLLSIIESTQIDSSLVSAVAGKYEVYRYRDGYIPVIRLHEVFGVQGANTALDDGLLVIMDAGRRIGLLVDDILGQQQVVIKSLRTNFRQIESLAGATILGDGTVAMIIDLPGLLEFWLAENESANTPSAAAEIST